MVQKILLVGDPRICPQVAYVMDWQNYETVEQLTDAEKYRKYKIVVCAMKRRSKNLVKIKDKTLNLTYLDDICRELDKDYSFTKQVLMINPKTQWKRWLRQIILFRGWRWLLNFLRKGITFRSQFWLRKIAPKFMKPSELFLRVLYSPSVNVTCNRLGNFCYIDHEGKIWGCCTGLALPFGTAALLDKVNVYDYSFARIIKLSALNHSYCLCDLKKCQFTKPYQPDNNQTKKLFTLAYPQELVIATERSCNLNCHSCQKCKRVAKAAEVSLAKNTHKELLNTDWLKKAATVNLAGMGEVFYGDAYRELLVQGLPREQIFIRTNGLLLNEKNWQLLKDKYKQIEVSVSVDAATPATYQKIRGGDFEQLQQNLAMLSKLRKNKELHYLEISFVVQRDNYQDMVAFVKLGQALHVDSVAFKQLENWGTFTRKEYARQRMIVKNQYLAPELYAILQDPIFKEPIVKLSLLLPLLVASTKHYGE